jgi:anti-anti-sigma regulatory factor
MGLSLAGHLSRFPPIVSFDEQLGVLRVAGDEDRTTSGRRRRPFSAAFKATRDVIVDMSELSFADPSLMIDLACLAQRLRASGQSISLLHPQPHIRTLIALVGLDRLPSVLVVTPAPSSAPAG